MAWNFADNIGDSFQQGYEVARQNKLDKQKAAQEQIQNRFKTMMDGTKTAMDVYDRIKDPTMKANILNQSVIPFTSLLTGNKMAPITPEMLQDPKTADAIEAGKQLTQDYLHQVPDPTTKKAMSLNEYTMRLGVLMASTKDAKEQMSPMDEALQRIQGSVKQNVPGPGNTDTTGTVDPLRGTVTPLTNTMTGQPTTTGPKPPKEGPDDTNKQRASLESGIARDEKTLQALINPSKGKAGLPDVQGSWLSNLRRGGKAPTWSDFSDKEQAQIALAQSTAQRLKSNMASVNTLRQAQGLEPIEVQPEALALADKLTKIQGIPQGGTAAATANPDQAAIDYLAKNHPTLKNPTPADIAWAKSKLPK